VVLVVVVKELKEAPLSQLLELQILVAVVVVVILFLDLGQQEMAVLVS
jgi:hypothetical protein